VIQFDKKARKVQVSIKALEVAEEKEAIAQYGSSDSGATLGDILGTALKHAAPRSNAFACFAENQARFRPGPFVVVPSPTSRRRKKRALFSSYCARNCVIGN
jgi:hypothetical protein